MSDFPILNFVQCPDCPSGNLAAPGHLAECHGGEARDARVQQAVAEMFATARADVHTLTPKQVKRRLMECEEALRTTEAALAARDGQADRIEAAVRSVLDQLDPDAWPAQALRRALDGEA